MSYKVNYIINSDFLRVKLSGSLAIEKFSEISNDIDRVIDENGINRILVDLRDFKERFGIFNGLQHIEKFREESKFLKFAILDNPKNRQNNDFFENASLNRGYQLLFFYDLESAEKWLRVNELITGERVIVKEY